MERSKVLSKIILVIKQLKKEVHEVFRDENIITHSDLLIEEYFDQKFTPLVRNIVDKIRSLPQNEYLAIELEAWVKVIRARLNEFEQGVHSEKYAEVLYIKRHYYPKLIKVLNELKLEVLENEFDARTDKPDFRVDSGPNTLIISDEVVAALVALLYNFNLISAQNTLEDICRQFAGLTGFSAKDIYNRLSVEQQSGRLNAEISRNELEILAKLLKSMLSRTEYVLSYKE